MAAAPALREEEISRALKFMGSEQAQGKGEDQIQEFLTSKGLTQAEIEEARRRHEQAKQAAPAQPQGGEQGQRPPTAAGSPPWNPNQNGSAPPQPGAPQYPQNAPQYTRPPQWQQVPGPYNPNAGAGPQYGMPPSYPGQLGGYPGQPGYPPPYPVGQPAPPFMLPQAPPQAATWPWLLGGGLIGAAASLGAIWLQNRSDETEESWFPTLQGLDKFAARQLDGAREEEQEPGAAGLPQAKSSSSTAPGDADPENTGNEATSKEAFEELVTLLRKHSEEAHENSLAFKKATTSLQDQFQAMLDEMQKFVTEQAQAQKQAKPEPLELSATTIQELANLLQRAEQPTPTASTAGAVVTEVAAPTGMSPAPVPEMSPQALGAVAPPPAPPLVLPDGAAGAKDVAPAPAMGSLREQFDAINLNLQRLVQQSNAKAEASKSMQTLCLILQNVVNNPSTEKHRKVNTTGARFNELFSTKSAAAELLKLAGFVYSEPNFLLAMDKSTDAALRVRDLVQSAQSNLEQMWAARAVPDSIPAEDASAPQVADSKVPSPALNAGSGECPTPSVAATALSSAPGQADAGAIAPMQSKPWLNSAAQPAATASTPKQPTTQALVPADAERSEGGSPADGASSSSRGPQAAEGQASSSSSSTPAPAATGQGQASASASSQGGAGSLVVAHPAESPPAEEQPAPTSQDGAASGAASAGSSTGAASANPPQDQPQPQCGG